MNAARPLPASPARSTKCVCGSLRQPSEEARLTFASRHKRPKLLRNFNSLRRVSAAIPAFISAPAMYMCGGEFDGSQTGGALKRVREQKDE